MGISKAYLIVYNLILATGWSWVLYLTVSNRSDYTKLYPIVRQPLQIFQTAAVLEVLHAVLGMVKSSPTLTGFQVFSRIFTVWAVLEISPPATVSLGVPLLLRAWCLAELTRYAYYFFNLLGSAPSLLTWFRYSLFIILYPIGIVGEGICAYTAMLNATGSFGFYYRLFGIIIGVVYIPVAPRLYLHMLEQRGKMLGKKAEGKSLKKN